MTVEIRYEKDTDIEKISYINNLAFGQTNEGMLVERLRLNPKFIKQLSLVAVKDDTVIGHILFFPIVIENGSKQHKSLALAPMSVLPEFQKKGVGSKLIKKGLKIAKGLKYKSVIVLGHKDYYPKFGFLPASNWGIKSPFNVPEDVFMAVELTEKGLKDVSGVVRYPKEFDEVG